MSAQTALGPRWNMCPAMATLTRVLLLLPAPVALATETTPSLAEPLDSVCGGVWLPGEVEPVGARLTVSGITPYPRYRSLDRRVVNIGETTSVTLTAVIDGNPTSVEIVTLGGSHIPMPLVSADTYQVTLTEGQVLAGYQVGDLHNVVGFVDIYDGATRVVRWNLPVNVRDSTVPDVPVYSVDENMQVSPHIVNIRHDDPWLGSPLPQISISRFYDLFEDDADFLGIVGNVTPIHNRYYAGVRNDTGGIGLSMFDNGAAWGSAEKLQGLIAFPIDSYFDLAEKAAIHELGHRWSNFLFNTPPLDFGIPHWPLADVAYGVMGFSIGGPGGPGGNFPFILLAQPSGDYILQQVSRDTEYNDLELYLMGLIAAEDVSQHFAFVNQNQYDQLFDGGILA